MPALKYLFLTPDWMVILSITLTTASSLLSYLVWREVCWGYDSRGQAEELRALRGEVAGLRLRATDLERERREIWHEYQILMREYAQTIPDDLYDVPAPDGK